MPQNQEIIIIGAGISGASMAYFLAAKGVTDILVIEKGNIASGATGRSSAMISPIRETVNILAWQSVQIYQNWAKTIGGDIGFRQTGSLSIFEKEAPYNLKWAQNQVNEAQAMGIDAELINPDELKLLQPHIRVDDIGGAIICHDAGYGDGYTAANAFMREARKLGVQFMSDVQVERIEVNKGKAVGIRTISGEIINSSTVVVATGAWSENLIRTAGFPIPIIPRRVCCAILKRPNEIRNHMTVGRDWTIGTYWRMEGPDLTVLGVRNREVMPVCDPDNYPEAVDESTINMWARRLIHRMPDMEKAGWQLVWTAPEAYMPDHTPMLGPVPDIKGLHIAVGFSGGGMTMGPIYGKCMAELITDGKATSGDIHFMRPSRFKEGKPNQIPTEDEWPYPTKIDQRFNNPE
jgi:sarcosine oxidase subunit beta